MKFFHIGDLHFGKMLYNVPLVQEDQAYWVEQFLKAVDQHEPDAVVIAGDVYDRRVPTPEAMRLFDYLLTELARRDKYVFVIPGNHDSAIRLSHVSELLSSHRIYIAGEVRRQMMHVTVRSDPADVTFWLMPYIFPKLVSDKAVLGEDDIATYDEAARKLLKAQGVDEKACNVLIAHQNVLANGKQPEHSESETIIGGVGEIDYTAFDAFDYVALGHIHNAQKVGRETVRYSGCPLYYDFSEIGRSKALTLVTINSKDDIKVEKVDIALRHTLLKKEGTLDELLDAGMQLQEKDRYYIQCLLTDRHVPTRAIEQLRNVYGNALINVKRILPQSPSSAAASPKKNTEQLTIDEMFGRFYQAQQDELLDDVQEKLIKKILEQETRRGEEYYSDAKDIPAQESEELLNYLEKAMEEKNETA